MITKKPTGVLTFSMNGKYPTRKSFLSSANITQIITPSLLLQVSYIYSIPNYVVSASFYNPLNSLFTIIQTFDAMETSTGASKFWFLTAVSAGI